MSDLTSSAHKTMSLGVRKKEGIEDFIECVNHGFVDVDLGIGVPSHAQHEVPQSSGYIADQGIKRYQRTLKSLIPFRRTIENKAVSKNKIEVDHAGLFSFIFCNWMSNIMYKGYRKGLSLEDIPICSPYDSCDHNVQRLEMFWLEEIKNAGYKGASFYRAIWRFSRTRFIVDCLILLASCILGFVSPLVFMRKLLEFAENSKAINLQDGLIWAVLLMLSELCKITLIQWRIVIAHRTAGRLRAACLGLIYKKIIQLNHIDEKSIGQLINIFANDSQRIFELVMFGSSFIGAPLVLICGVVYVLHFLGAWALFGILVFIAFYPIQYSISRLSGALRRKTLQVSDKRVSLMSEILFHIKNIKVNAYEDVFEDQIYEIRSTEQKLISKTTYLASFGMSLGPTVPIISAVVTFLAHIGSSKSLTAAQAFPVLAFYSYSARFVTRAFQTALSSLYDASVGLERIQLLAFTQIYFWFEHAKDGDGLNMFSEATVFADACTASFGRYSIVFNLASSYLLMEDVQSKIHHPFNPLHAVFIDGASFSWNCNRNSTSHSVARRGKEKSLTTKLDSNIEIEAAGDEMKQSNSNMNQIMKSSIILVGIDFHARKGHLVGICGPVGSGKTSLILAILGQMNLIHGQMTRHGTCAYVSQQAWVKNGTIRDNILFGETFLTERYYRVLNVCTLNEDLNQLPGGDLTEIGERGVNLSGGQKQRVALARALYANRDIYLLDDPLSAVDVSVGTYIFENYILKELQNKTVILVSHQFQYLRHCDSVYVMKGGSITEHGTNEELLELDREYASMVKQMNCYSQIQTSDINENRLCNSQESVLAVKMKGALAADTDSLDSRGDGLETLTVREPSNLRSLEASSYFRYISAAGGYSVVVLVFLFFLANVGSSAFSSWWLATWMKAGGGNAILKLNNGTAQNPNLADNPDFAYYQTIYCSTILIILLSCGFRSAVITKASIGASSKLHKALFETALKSPMAFFESNPIGRLQNLFSRDMDEVDLKLPSTVENIINNFWMLAFAILFTGIVFPWYFVAFIPLAVVFYVLARIFRRSIRDLKHLENTTRSPIFSILVETLQGLNTICAFNKEKDYLHRFYQMYDLNFTCNYLWNTGMRWLAVRVDLLAALAVSITAFLVVLLHGTVAPAMAGLALSYSSHISSILQYTIRLVSETEVRFISVERILAYVDSAVLEGKPTSIKPPASWPDRGLIHFQNVCLSYRKNLPNSLHNVSFSIVPGEKIGIVGRTGSGKSSLAVALFRLVELSSGIIKLDDFDISEVPLPILRTKIAIISQDPVIFCGTVRSNLDFKGKHSDKELWEVLARSKLSDRVSAMPMQLDTVVSNREAGLSLGECQLMCLARSLLERCKVLILDEATASLDPGTEAEVMSTIMKEFDACTILIIAHRLSTVTNCDRILVMDNGKLLEFDSPGELLAKQNSAFSRMMASGEASLTS